LPSHNDGKSTKEAHCLAQLGPAAQRREVVAAAARAVLEQKQAALAAAVGSGAGVATAQQEVQAEEALQAKANEDATHWSMAQEQQLAGSLRTQGKGRGGKYWGNVAANVDGKTGVQCYHKAVCAKTVDGSTWTLQADQALLAAVQVLQPV
jgi:hypothetical protein